MVAYDPAEWSDFFVAVAGAAAALSGLVFVAISINVERIIKGDGLPERALETILLLLGVLVAAVIGLVPGQSDTALGLELIASGLLFLLAILVQIRRGTRNREEALGPRGSLPARIGFSVLGSAPFAIAGLSLIVDAGGGLYWAFAATVFALLGGVLNAWVLLVEILR